MTVKAGSEAAWEMVVQNLAGYGDWMLEYHTHDSRRSQAGWPDWVFCREATDEYLPELIFVELKAERTKVSDDQYRWLGALRSLGFEAYLWRPADKPAVEERLLRPRVYRGASDGSGPGRCAGCESPNVHPLNDDRFRCNTCHAKWTGRRGRLAA